MQLYILYSSSRYLFKVLLNIGMLLTFLTSGGSSLKYLGTTNVTDLCVTDKRWKVTWRSFEFLVETILDLWSIDHMIIDHYRSIDYMIYRSMIIE